MKIIYAESWFKQVLNAMDDMVLVKGEKSKLLWANNSFLSYYGMSEDELYNIVDGEHSDPDDTLQYVRDDKYVFDKNRTLKVSSEPVTDFAGTTRYFHTIKSPIFDNTGKTIRSVGISRPIEDKGTINLSKEVRSSRKDFINFQKQFINNVKIPSLFLDAQNRVITASESFSKLFKISANYFIDKQAIEIFPDLDDFNLGKGINFYAAIKTSHMGIEMQGDLTISPWNFSENETGGNLLLFKNRTEEIAIFKQLEEEKKRGIVDDRLRSLGVLSAGIAHEINNPLTIIIGLIQNIEVLKRDEIKNTGILDDLSKIKKHSFRISNIVKGLQSLSRNNISDDFEENSISGIINNACALCAGEIKSQGIKIVIPPENDIKIICNPGQIIQVMFNLLTNAICEIKDNENPWIKVEIQEEDQNVLINVIDSGTGLSSEVVNKIFDPFFTTKAPGSGTGLGLGISKEIIIQHQGELYLNESHSNTMFTIQLKRVST
jgi:two-component system phosphate regulon sensor histidine kinase PhoR